MVKITRQTIRWVLTQCQGYWRRESAHRKDVTGKTGRFQGDRSIDNEMGNETEGRGEGEGEGEGQTDRQERGKRLTD